MELKELLEMEEELVKKQTNFVEKLKNTHDEYYEKRISCDDKIIVKLADELLSDIMDNIRMLERRYGVWGGFAEIDNTYDEIMDSFVVLNKLLD